MLRLLIRDEPVCLPPNIVDDPSLETWPDRSGQEYGFGLERDGKYWMKVHSLGTFVVESSYQNVIGFPDRGVDSDRFQEGFFHGVAPWLLQRREWDCLHGSSVLRGGGVVVFCGPSGRGKSTLARAWADRGAVPYADDAVPFLARDGVVMSAKLPQPIRLREPAASHFADLAPPKLACTSSEVVYNPEPTLRPLRSIYWLAPAQSPNRRAAILARVPPVEAFSLTLSVAHCMSLRDRACNRKLAHNYLSLAGSTPVFRLSIAPGLKHLPAVLDCLERNQREL